MQQSNHLCCYFYYLSKIRSTIEENMDSFRLKPTQIKTLFDVDRIKSGLSNQILQSWGSIHALQALLQTNYSRGIQQNEDQRERRIKTFGKNSNNKPQETLWSKLRQIIAQSLFTKKYIFLHSILAIHIIYGLIVNDFSRQYLTVKGLLALMLLYSSLQSFSIYYKWSLQQNYRNNIRKKARIVRGAKQIQICEEEILVGDILKISAGDLITINGVIISNQGLVIDHPLMNDCDNTIFVLFGSKIIKGQGDVVVCEVGVKPRNENITESKLQQVINLLSNKIQRIALFTINIIIVVSLTRILYHFSQVNILQLMFQTIKAVLIIKVITTKDEFRQFLGLAYAYYMNKMSNQNFIPMTRNVAESVGSITDICINKTGLLTTNQIKVHRLFCQGFNNHFQSRQKLHEQTTRMICLSICNNSTATPVFQINNEELKTVYVGSQVQCALLEASYHLGFNYNRFRDKSKQVKVFNFESHRKMMATVYKDDNHSLYVLVKGAPQLLLPHCVEVINKEGVQCQLLSQHLDCLNEVVEDYGSKSLRTILLAYKQVMQIPQSWEDICHSLVCLAIFGLKDALRKSTSQAVSLVASAGINLRIITSDNKMTAISVAKESGIIPRDWIETDEDCTVMEAGEFRQFVGGLINEGTHQQTVGDIQNFRIVEKQLRLIVRSTPQDKYLFVVGMQALGRKTAVIVNETDNFSLNYSMKADIMLLTTKLINADFPKSIALQRYDLASIASGVRLSRMMSASIEKMVKFQLNLAIVSISMIVIGMLLYGESPLKVFQIIWIHFILSLFVGLALIVEVPSRQSQQEICSKQDMLNRLFSFTFIQATMQVAKLCFYLFYGPQLLGMQPSFPSYEGQYKKHETIFFNIFAMTQIFTSFSACHSNSPLSLFVLSNRKLLVIILTSVALQLLVIKLGSELFGLVQLSLKQNIFSILIGIGSVLPCFGSKFLMQRSKKMFSLFLAHS